MGATDRGTEDPSGAMSRPGDQPSSRGDATPPTGARQADDLDPMVATWVTSAAGLAALDQVTARLDAGADELAVGTALRRDHPLERANALVQLAQARRRARGRWASADRLLFTRAALEQASDPTVAAWRAGRFAGHRVVDLGCGVGGDLLALAARTDRLRGVDLDTARITLAGHNIEVAHPERQVELTVGDAFEVDVGSGQLAHADPARRTGDRRVLDPRRTSPPVDRLLRHLAPADGAGIVVAPGTDADHPVLAGVDGDIEVEYVQLGGQLVEAIIWVGALAANGATASATLLDRPTGPDDPGLAVAARAHRQRRRPWRDAAGEAASAPITTIGDWLIELAPAAVRARVIDELADELGLTRVARHRALLTGHEPPRSPWIRARPVVAVLAARRASIKRWLRSRQVPPVELVTHGLAMDVPTLWRELGRPARGPGGWRVEFVRRDDDTIVVVTDASTPTSGW